MKIMPQPELEALVSATEQVGGTQYLPAHRGFALCLGSIFRILYETGLRPGKLVRFDLSSCEVHGPGGLPIFWVEDAIRGILHKVPIRDSDTVSSFLKYLVEGRPVLTGRNQTEEALFLNTAGRRVNTWDLVYHLRRTLMITGLEGTGLTLGGFRRSYLFRHGKLASQFP